MLSYPFRQLAAFCASHPIAQKLLFVPAAQAGYNLTTALALSGHSWVNLRTLTPAQHAEEIADSAYHTENSDGLARGFVANEAE